MNEKFVHIDVIVDITDPEQISALSTFLTKIGKNVQTTEEKPNTADFIPPRSEPEKPAEPEAPKPARKRSSKPAAPAESEEPAEPETPAAPAEPEKPASGEKTYQVEEVREKLKEKVSEHREEIKAKLTELGAPNVSSLDPSKYTEFVNFLEGLE